MNDRQMVIADGSTVTVEPITQSASLISRYVDGRCVWAQAFGHGEDHVEQVASVLGSIQADPDAFCWWWLRPEVAS